MSVIHTQINCPPHNFAEISGSPILLKTYASTVNAGVSNQQLIAGVSGQCIRVLAATLWSNITTPLDFYITDGSGGTSLFVSSIQNVALQLPPCEFGYFDTSAGNGLYITVGASAGKYIMTSLRYIIYTPTT